ncbi:MAG: hypothetical protein ACTSU0_02945 [Alphaproteobacteria bacterium]
MQPHFCPKIERKRPQSHLIAAAITRQDGPCHLQRSSPMYSTETTSRHDARTTRSYVVWIIAYAAIMVCLFALPNGGNIAPDMIPAGFGPF